MAAIDCGLGRWPGVQEATRFCSEKAAPRLCSRLRLFTVAPPMLRASFLLSLLSALACACFASLMAVPPPLRTELSLAGEWPVGGPVPVYGGSPTPVERLSYARTVVVPAKWAGYRIQLEWSALNFASEIFVDGQRVAAPVGAWRPGSVDLTDRVRPGAPFELRIELEGMNGPRTVGADGWERWPVGNQRFDGRFAGIADDLWLRAYGDVSIRDTFIQPDVVRGRLVVTHTVHNDTDTPQAVSLHTAALLWSAAYDPANPPAPERIWPSLPFSLAPGETRELAVHLDWADARLWTPDTPHLYVLRTEVHRRGEPIDVETRRFGFREFRVQGERFSLNGVPTTLRGDYLGFGGYIPVAMQTPAALPETYRLLKRDLGINALRWHLRPAPGYVYDLADEIGLLIVAETSVYGRPDSRLHMPPEIKAEYLANVHAWLLDWIRSRRNHPSIVVWSVINEMGPKYRNHQGLTVEELKAAGAVVRALDPTRPLLYHGNAEVRDEDMVSYHYPGRPPEDPRADIYQWRRLLVPGKPTGVGEYFQTSPTAPGQGTTQEERVARAELAKDWMGIFTRGLRHLGFADLRPKNLFWTLREPAGSWRVEAVKNTNAAVALFDLDYDELGIAPLRDGALPEIAARGPLVLHQRDVTEKRFGATVTHTGHEGAVKRRLRLYNEDWSGDRLAYAIETRRGSTVVARVEGIRQIAPGHHETWEQLIPIPAEPGRFTVERTVHKDGVLRFRESRDFILTQ